MANLNVDNTPPAQVPEISVTPEQLMAEYILELAGSPALAIALAGKYARGPRLREIVAAIDRAWLRASKA